MRVGVIGPRQPQTIGGGFSFQDTILRALGWACSAHSFIVLDVCEDPIAASMYPDLECIHIARSGPTPSNNSSLSSCIDNTARTAKLDIIWYLDPLADVHSIPVFATVLDLAHRIHPFFPEVSTRGWTWDAREAHYRRILPRAARVITGTNAGKLQVIDFYGVYRDNVIVNPFPVPCFPKEANEMAFKTDVLKRYSLSPGYLLYPAQFWPHKNHSGLVRALAIIRSVYGLTPHVVFTGADHGNRAYVTALTSELGLSSYVRFLDFVPRQHLPALYSNALCLVYPSFFGPDNLPPLEAFSLNCPVLAAHVEGVEDQLGKEAVKYFNPANPEDIANAILEIMRNPKLKLGLTSQGKVIAESRTAKNYVGAMEKAFTSFTTWRETWDR